MNKYIKILRKYILIFLIFLLPLTVNLRNNSTEKKEDDTLQTFKEKGEEKNLNYYLNKYSNEDIIARISIDNTSLNEAVVKSINNNFYLNHNIEKEEDIRGNIFLDYRTDENSKKKIIYGHNSSNYQVPFRELENYYNQTYFNNHQIIKLEWTDKLEKYQIFSVFIETSDWSYTRIKFQNDEEYLKHLYSLKEKSLHETDIELTSADEILILQTCSHHKDYRKYDKKYLLVIAKKIN